MTYAIMVTNPLLTNQQNYSGQVSRFPSRATFLKRSQGKKWSGVILATIVFCMAKVSSRSVYCQEITPGFKSETPIHTFPHKFTYEH